MHLRYHATINDYKLLIINGPTIHKLPLSSTIPSYLIPSGVRDVVALATLDGLVCLAAASTGDIVFWNPLTGAYRKLSSIDPDLSFYTHSLSDVFGFYKDNDYNYKLLCLKRGGHDGAYIYSHVLDAWRPIDFSFAFKSNHDPYTFCSWSPATLWGQCLYFTVTAYYMSMERYCWIICFDVRTETFRKIRFPTIPSRNFCGTLIVLNEGLHLCVTYDVDYLMHGEMWRMNGERWVKVAAFSDPGVRQQHICTLTAGNWLAVIDHENNSFEKVNQDDFITRYPYFCSTRFEYRYSLMIYVETLVSPDP